MSRFSVVVARNYSIYYNFNTKIEIVMCMYLHTHYDFSFSDYISKIACGYVFSSQCFILY